LLEKIKWLHLGRVPSSWKSGSRLGYPECIHCTIHKIKRLKWGKTAEFKKNTPFKYFTLIPTVEDSSSLARDDKIEKSYEARKPRRSKQSISSTFVIPSLAVGLYKLKYISEGTPKWRAPSLTFLK
jgi:hypothetical protein